MKTLFYDIETSLIIAGVWGMYDQNVPYKHILHDWRLLSAAWKWKGQKRIHAISGLDAGDTMCDKNIIEKMIELMNEADVIVGHNGDNFDWKKFMARVIFHGLPAPKKPLMVDTLKEARRTAKFTSNKLDDLGTQLDTGNKLANPTGLWLDATMGCKKAIKHMVKYNKADIPPLEALYDKLQPYVTGRPNVGLWKDTPCCPSCGSENFIHRGFTRKGVTAKKRFSCNDCGSWFQSGKAVKSVEMRK